MANYPIGSYNLAFQNDYLALLVKENGQVVETFSLTEEGKGIKLEIVNDEYTLSVVDRPTGIMLAFDTAQDPEFNFDGNRLGGNVIIDLRDIGRYTNPDDFDTFVDFEFELECTPNIFWNAGGPKGLKIWFEDEFCHTITFS